MSPKDGTLISSLKKWRRHNPFLKHPRRKLQFPVISRVLAVSLWLFRAGYLKDQAGQAIRMKSINSMAEHLSSLSPPIPTLWGAFFPSATLIFFQMLLLAQLSQGDNYMDKWDQNRDALIVPKQNKKGHSNAHFITTIRIQET